jgi:hypothetical protein
MLTLSTQEVGGMKTSLLATMKVRSATANKEYQEEDRGYLKDRDSTFTITCYMMDPSNVLQTGLSAMFLVEA